MATEAEEDVKAELFNLLSTDKDLISKVTQALSMAEKLEISCKQEVFNGLSHEQLDLKQKQQELTGKVQQLETEMESNKLKFMDEVDNINQYGHRNCLLVHGVTEAPQENTDDTVIDIFKSKLNVDITKQDLDRSHRLRSRRQNFNRPRPIIIKFCSYNRRAEIFRIKRHLKNTGITISESLIAHRQHLMYS
ncbi:Hypothetical predicted protein [Paramuricea clavata]|uniref:Uncharacterized protein n=1 Tax=Paramuricea clavata TaxID=317549 RepID=A0A7D9I9N4_PARCT|nr:Hypothetical predicted protein [Paramuricea clavata]